MGHETPDTERLKESWYGNLCTSAPSLAALGIAGTSSTLLSLARYFEEVFFALGKFFAAFVFSETVAAAAHAGCLNGED